MKHTQTATVDKSKRGWHVETRQRWAGWANEAVTCGGEVTLDWALYSIAAWCRRSDTALVGLTINGQAASKARVQQAIDALGARVLSEGWRLELTA